MKTSSSSWEDKTMAFFHLIKKITRDVFNTKHRSDRLQKLLLLGQKQILWEKKNFWDYLLKMETNRSELYI